MASGSGVQNYLNTLIFCIVAKAVTIGLLGLLLLETGKKLAYLILTIQIVMVVIIIWSLVEISRYDKDKAKQMEDFMKSKPNLDTCPDYYVKSTNSDGLVQCSSEINLPGKLTYNMAHDNARQKLQNFTLESVIQASGGNTYESVCNMIGKESSDYNKIAWTDLRANCIN